MAFKKYSAKKDPDSIVDYGRNWGGSEGWLNDSETIGTSIWIITSDDEEIPTLIEESKGFDSISTSIWLSGGTPGLKYKLTNRILTSDNRLEDRTGILTVEEK